MVSRQFENLRSNLVAFALGLKPAASAKTVTVLVSFLAVMAATPAFACKLAILGDSLTAGYGVRENQAFPAQLAVRLETEGIVCDVINAGVSGDTSAGGASRIGWVLADTPTHLLVELGANDALRALPIEQLHDNLTAIVETARAAGVKVMLAGMLAPPNLGPEYGQRFASVYSEIAKTYNAPLYPFFLEGVAARPQFLIEDGMHPNAAGISVIVDRMTPQILSFLSSR